MTESNVKEMFKMMDKCLSAIDEFRAEVRLELGALKTDVAQLKTDVAQLKTDVAQLKTDVAQLKTDVAQLKTDVAQLKTDVAQLKTDVAQLKTDVAQMKESQDRFELELRRNNRALDKVAGHWIRTDIQVGRLEDAMA